MCTVVSMSESFRSSVIMYGLGYSLQLKVTNISNCVSATMTGHGVEVLEVGVKIMVCIFALTSVYQHLQAIAGSLWRADGFYLWELYFFGFSWLRCWLRC